MAIEYNMSINMIPVLIMLSVLPVLPVLPASALATESRSILFLGNSYTRRNNLPALVKAIAGSEGKLLKVKSLAKSSYQLRLHVSDPSTNPTIEEEDWHAVILQGQSQNPALPTAQELVFPAAATLSSEVKSNANCSRLLFFQTWGRKVRDSRLCPHFPDVFCSFNAMTAKLNSTYVMLAAANEGEVVPVGIVWKYLRDHYPAIELFHPDEHHPSLVGSYVAAMTFYSAIFWADPRGITYYPEDLNEEEVNATKEAVYAVVTEDLDKWYLRRVPQDLQCISQVTTSPPIPLSEEPSSFSPPTITLPLSEELSSFTPLLANQWYLAMMMAGACWFVAGY